MHCRGCRSQFCTCHRSLFASRAQRFTALPVVRCLAFARFPSLALGCPFVAPSREFGLVALVGLLAVCSMRSAVQDRVIGLNLHLASPGDPKPVSGPDRLDGPARLGRRGFDRHRPTGDSAAPGPFCGARNGRRPKFWKINHFLSGPTDPIVFHRKIGVVALVRIGKWRILYVGRARRLCAQSPTEAKG
jgi:hypothetical protein